MFWTYLDINSSSFHEVEPYNMHIYGASGFEAVNVNVVISIARWL
jgi:hypothetical protein